MGLRAMVNKVVCHRDMYLLVLHDMEDGAGGEGEGLRIIIINSVPNRPGARRGPAGGLPRAPDGTGRLAVVRPVRAKGRTAVFG